MNKVEIKINALKCDFVKYCLPVLLLKHFFWIFLNYYFGNFVAVFAGAIFVGIILGTYASYLSSPEYFVKLTNINCVLFLLFDLVYGFLNQTVLLCFFLNIFLFPWLFYMFFSLKKTIILTCGTMLVYPAHLFLRSYLGFQEHSDSYESYTFHFLWIFNLMVLFITVYYGTEIKKYNSILFFEKEKKLQANQNSDQKREFEKNANISCQLIFEKIDLYMKNEEPWRNADYNLEQLALELRLNVFQISNAINYCTKNNFKSYLNDYRLNAFVEEIKTHKSKDFLLKEVYLNLGFNSRATFNRNFKSKFRKTPQQFVAMHIF
ncbi:hypothetical protein B0A81_18650 [Flavobacterium plurextorum]|uniref:HTH araC/xylS-type domain-containing protein n=2 Tax=Flavobacterium plurextorum TaxID=1114867 RepID=A0ABX4CPU2_9FLAO|nr:hypothetical protein B0A81_18650 [Flavobacterium plurextorum]